jgi:hypothetical protein
MYNTHEFLLHTIIAIRKSQEHRGNTATDEQIAERAGIPTDIFKRYVTGNLPLPDNFVDDLMTKYGISFHTIHDVVEYTVRDSDTSENEE